MKRKFYSTPPEDIHADIMQLKRNLTTNLPDLAALFAKVTEAITQQVEEIEQLKVEGKEVWPILDYKDIRSGKVSPAQIEQIHRRGCAVVRGHFPHKQARQWDKDMLDYVSDNHFFDSYRGPGDSFFGTLSASTPEIYPVYWSRPQMEARQSERMVCVQSFLNRLWKFESEGKQWFDPDKNCLYPDRVRRRPPGTSSQGLGAHIDSGALERWLVPEYQTVFRHILAGDPDQYDPWDAAYRTKVHEYAGGSTKCSAFRTFQGWTALSDMQNDQGVLFTVPIPSVMPYVLLRPLLEDVAEDELCGVQAQRVLPLLEQWHALLLRAKTVIPNLQAGDSVWWHCDMIHGVEPVENQQGWGNVMYIPATPYCEKNSHYAKASFERFLLGQSPEDFPKEDYEVNWENRFKFEDLNENGKVSVSLP